MSSDRRGVEDTPTESRSSNGWLLLEFLKAAKIPLLVGLLCFGGFLVVLYRGVPAREIGLGILTVLFVAPLVAAYGLLWAWHYDRESSVPIQIRDPEHDEIGLKMLSPDEWAETEIDGELATRTGMFTGRTVHVAEGHEWEQREQINRDAGVIEEVPVRVLRGTWEMELDYLTFLEEREEFSLWKDEIVPLARAGLQERAGADVRVMTKIDRLGHALVAGAEKDQFMAADADPFGWSIEDDDLPGDLDETFGRPDDSEEEESAEADPSLAQLLNEHDPHGDTDE